MGRFQNCCNRDYYEDVVVTEVFYSEKLLYFSPIFLHNVPWKW